MKKNNVIGLLRQYIGVTLYDLPFKLTQALGSSEPESGVFPWINLCNRGEKLVRSEAHTGVMCDWNGGSDLYLPKVLPACGRWLYRRAFQDFPVEFKEQYSSENDKVPHVSFLIGHRGLERLPLLLATLQTIAAQVGCRIECIVIEQDVDSQIKNALPEWVRYVQAPLEDGETAYSRSRAFNVGARIARSPLLVLHDGDLLVPQDYAKEVYKLFLEGFEFINLKRFIFYLDQRSSGLLCTSGSIDHTVGFDAVVQNLVGGASLAISKSSYFDIGGFDERFIGWGYEDIEFTDRAETLKRYAFDYLPFIHLWHKAQKGKWTAAAPGLEIYKKVSKIPVDIRIKELNKQIMAQ